MLGSSRKALFLVLAIFLAWPAPVLASSGTERQLLGEYTTRFDPNKVNRSHNIALAAKAINGMVVKPGKEFSFNRATGPRSKERGYLPAPVLKGGRLVDDYGGGVCQVSSTLHAAIVQAGIRPKERHPHSVPVKYIRRNLEAAVAWGIKDLRFVNPLDDPLLIEAFIPEPGVLTVRVYALQGKGH